MNFYTPNGHAAYATQQPINSNNNNHHEQQQNALQAALQTFDQPPAPSLREVLGAYRLKGDGDREMLLAILNAKAAEDQVWNSSFFLRHNSDIISTLSLSELQQWLNFIKQSSK